MVFDVASSDLVNMGMTVISYTIKDIKDEQGYLRALGMARTAQVRMPASVDQFDDQLKRPMLFFFLFFLLFFFF